MHRCARNQQVLLDIVSVLLRFAGEPKRLLAVDGVLEDAKHLDLDSLILATDGGLHHLC